MGERNDAMRETLMGISEEVKIISSGDAIRIHTMEVNFLLSRDNIGDICNKKCE